MLSFKKPWQINTAALLAGFTSIAFYCFFLSRHRILWSDELFGWMLVTDPDWRHMFWAWRQGADGGGMLFYTFARVWFEATGRTVLCFRAFSATCCFIGFAAMWFLLRRFYSVLIGSVALLIVWFGSRIILWQMIQTRFYGLMLAAAALSLLAAVRSSSDAGLRLPRRPATLALTLASNFVLIGSHPFGVLYSATILLGSLLSDILARRWRPFFYISAVLPWTLLLASREAMTNSAKVGKPYFWTTRPGVHEFVSLYGQTSKATVVLLVIVSVFTLISARWRNQILAAFRERSALLFPALLLALLPVPIWLISQRGTSYFVDRYLIGFTLGIAVLGAEVLTQLYVLWVLPRKPVFRPAFAILIVLLVCQSAQEALVKFHRIALPPLDFTGELASRIPRGLPVIIERPDIFDMMLAQRRAPDLSFYYLLDWNTAISPESPRGIVSGHHEMENWKRVGYFSSSILQSDEFLSTTNRFVVMDDSDLKWFEFRILKHPEWKITPIADYRNDPWSGKLWLVERQDSPPL